MKRNRSVVRFKPKNIPIPEVHVVAIAVGVLLHVLLRMKILPQAQTGRHLGWLLATLGTGVASWAVVEAGEMDISRPQELITSGPYAYSRNPMYVGWSLIYLGISLLLNSMSLVVLLPFVLFYSHLVDIRSEEKYLEREFGPRYRAYRNRVRRYL